MSVSLQVSPMQVDVSPADATIGVKLGDVEVRLPTPIWTHHSAFVKTNINLVDEKQSLTLTFQRSPKSLLVIEQLLRLLQTSTDRGQVVAPLPSRAPLEVVYQWNGQPDEKLISFLTSTFPIPFSTEQRAVLSDTMNLCNELMMDTALDIFASYFAFEHEFNELAQRLAATKSSSQQTPQPSQGVAQPSQKPSQQVPMDICN